MFGVKFFISDIETAREKITHWADLYTVRALVAMEVDLR